jgi:hypothetical protein
MERKVSLRGDIFDVCGLGGRLSEFEIGVGDCLEGSLRDWNLYERLGYLFVDWKSAAVILCRDVQV